MKRLLMVAAALLAGGLVGQVAAQPIAAQPPTCAALVQNPTAMQAAQELRRYASDIQGEAFQDATRGHVLTLLDLAEEMENAPRVGCVMRVTPVPVPARDAAKPAGCAVAVDGATRDAAIAVIDGLMGAAMRTDGYMVDLALLQAAQRVTAALETATGPGCEVTR